MNNIIINLLTMSNLISDIVNDYKSKISKGVYEVYYKKDIFEGLKLIVTLIGIGKIVILVGGALASVIGSIISLGGRNPNVTRACIYAVSRNSDEIVELITLAGDKFNKAYNSLSEKERKYIRSVILLAVKGGIHWDDLH